MMKDIHLYSKRKQSGQFLLHLAEIFVSTGLVVGVAMQGTVYLEKFQYAEAYDDLRVIENEIWAYHENHDAWPSDCQAGTSGCNLELQALFAAIKQKLAENADHKGWDRQFAIQQIKTPAGKLKHAIILNDVAPELAHWLDQKIDGQSTLASGRTFLGEYSPDLAANDFAYVVESQLH